MTPTPGTLSAPVWTVHCDGSAVPNPGRMGLGAVVTGPHGQCHTVSQATDAPGCNNEAELRALMAALALARQHGASVLRVYSDSTILVKQLGVAPAAPAAPIARLAGLFDQARALLAAFDQVDFEWVPRARNGTADALARHALGLAPKAPRKWKHARR